VQTAPAATYRIRPGGKTDFCWLIFERGWEGPAEPDWLHRDVEAM